MILAIDLSRGIVIAWKKILEVVTLTHVNRQIAFGVMSIPNERIWVFGVVQAITYALESHQVWAQAGNILFLGIPPILARDFNCILHTVD